MNYYKYLSARLWPTCISMHACTCSWYTQQASTSRISPGLVFLEALSAEPVSAWTLHGLLEQVLPAVCTPQLRHDFLYNRHVVLSTDMIRCICSAERAFYKQDLVTYHDVCRFGVSDHIIDSITSGHGIGNKLRAWNTPCRMRRTICIATVHHFFAKSPGVRCLMANAVNGKSRQ